MQNDIQTIKNHERQLIGSEPKTNLPRYQK